MNAERTPGIVLRVRPLSETSLIVHWLTERGGRLATVAKGARRPKSPFRGKLDLFFEVDLSFQRRRRSDLHLLREVVVRDPHPVLRSDLARLRAAAYAVQLLELATEPDTPVPELYALLRDLLRADTVPPDLLALAFEWQLLKRLGLQPNPEQTRLGPEARLALRVLGAGPLAALGPARPEPAVLRELARFLGGFVAGQFGRVPPARSGVFCPAEVGTEVTG